MDITTDLARVQGRIAEITGVIPGAGAPASAAPSTFAGMVKGALSGGPDPATAGPAMLPPAQIDGLVASNSSAWGVDPALVKAIIANESGFNASATSRTGAQGLMQLEPGTAAGLGVSDAYDPAQNVSGGTRYIRGLLDRFHGDMRLAVAAYNAGPGAVEKYAGVPPYAETQNYVQNVLSSYEKYKNQTSR
ncbi:MAG: lytic transglycosylase domain-containing protein [Candidatus Eremiobacteraeota bacterium]|nr:lytic transglycosylase domain-containing protein [Candidatus Eremiobacteraeota bacterium]